MTNRLKALLFLAIAISGTLSAGFALKSQAQAQPAQNDAYTWQPLRIGGGGFVTGIVAHPTEPDTLVAKTDVGGAYLWNAESAVWEQLLIETAVPNPQQNDYAVESVAIAPSDSERLYIAAGNDTDSANGRILASADGGQSWTDSSQRWLISGNEEAYRTGGERLAVDPLNADIVYFGSRTLGLWFSADGAETWQQVPTSEIPIIESDEIAGVYVVLFDPTGPTNNGRTQRLYAAVQNGGIYRSDDAGSSWAPIFEAAGVPLDMEIDSNGQLLFVMTDDGADSGSLSRYDPASKQTVNLSPNNWDDYRTVAVDPFNPDRIFIGTFGLTSGFYRSADGGQTWDSLQIDINEPDVAWPEQSTLAGYMSIGNLIFDPTVPGKLWFAEGMGVWHSSDLDDETVTWEFESLGIEELVSNDVAVLLDGTVVTAHWDRGLYHHPTPHDAVYDAQLAHSGRFNSAWDIDTSPADPDFVTAVVSDHRFCCEDDGEAYQGVFSLDSGRSWQQFPTRPESLKFGNIAVAANDTQNIVWLPSFNEAAQVTKDRGQTWQTVNLPGTDGDIPEGSHFAHYLNRRVLTADQVLPNTFYLLHSDLGIMRSADGGESWENLASNNLPFGWPAGYFNAHLLATPGRAEELFFTPGLLDGQDTGFYHSTNGGADWNQLPNVSNVEVFGFGKAAQNSDHPTLFIAGMLDGERGIWRSIDGGQSWTLTATAPAGIYDSVKALDGDKEVFGRVYVGFSGVGFVVGSIGQEQPPSNQFDWSAFLPFLRRR